MAPLGDSPPPITVGVDIGSTTTKVVLGTRYSCEIVRSDAGLHVTPTAVSFSAKTRQVGETAKQQGNNGIYHLNRLLALGVAKTDFLEDFYTFRYDKETDSGAVAITVDYNGEERIFPAPAILAMLLASIQKSVKATMERMQTDSTQGATIQYLFTVEPGSDPSIHRQLLDAAHAAGLDQVQLVESPKAYASAYQRKFPEFGTQEGKVALIVDVGHAQTCASVVRFETKDDARSISVLSFRSLQSLGAVAVDIRLFHHFQSTVPALKSVTPKSRAGGRLLQGCHELKHLLSQLPEGKVTVENVGENDTDISLQATRSTLAELCEPDAKALQELIQSALTEANLEAVDAVEVVGGGCRIPWVQAAIQAVLPDKEMVLSKSLDDTSAALGAALVGEQSSTEGLVVAIPEPTEADLERRNKLRDEEAAMAELDLDEKAKAEIRNQIEALLLELRSARDGKHGALLPKDSTLDDYLNTMDDWLYSEEADEFNREAMEGKLEEMKAKTRELCADYYNAVQEEQKAMELEMEAAAQQAKAENDANGDEDDDHDNRRLPKKRRMEIVLKNKSEANELFKDGNWRFAAARYTKALSHCAKFVDLNPDDQKEVNELKVTLNLNLALAYMKLENMDQCLRVCNEAITLDDSSAKAYFRRASVYYEKKKWDEAKKDIVKAKKLTEGDKAIQKLSDRIDLQLKKEKEKEKKMASKMFG